MLPPFFRARLLRRGPWRRLVAAVVPAVVFLVAGSAPAASQAARSTPLVLGFNDFDLAGYSGFRGMPVDESALDVGLANGRKTGATDWRVLLQWNQIARNASTPPQPASLAADPAWSGYVWDDVDRQLRAVAAAGLRSVVWPIQAPTWAEGDGRPAVSDAFPRGTFRPSSEAYGFFARALAKRYSGTYPDPARPGASLPKVDQFQAWNEPNLSTYLTPQWQKTGGRWKLVSPGLYRDLANAFAKGVKAVQPRATVVSGGTAPFGDLSNGDPRVQPARFYRELLCVKSTRGKLIGRRGCPKLHVDAWAHHTYPIGPPWRTARNADDVVVPDMPKLTRIVNAAAKAKTLSTSAAKKIWMTEMSWESKPDPRGLDLQTQAFYLQGSFYLLWKSGVRHIFWWNSRDNAQGRDWDETYQSGVYARGATPALDTPKPSLTAFRFPFAAFRDRGVAQLWARPPGSGLVVVQVETSPGTWKNAVTLKNAGGGVVTGKLRVNPETNLRAVQGTETSIVWTTF